MVPRMRMALPACVAFEAPHAVDPAGRAIVGADDAVFAIEEFVVAEHVFRKIRGHRVAIFGVNERGPAFDGALVIATHSEDFIEDVGGGPEVGLQIEDVGAQTGNALRLLQRTCQVRGVLRVGVRRL